MSESEFWTKYFESMHFHTKNKSATQSNTNLKSKSNNDMFTNVDDSHMEKGNIYIP